MGVTHWPEVPQAALQRWLDTAAPDYEMQHSWAENRMVVHRRTGEAFAYERNTDKKCFVHPEFLDAVMTP